MKRLLRTLSSFGLVGLAVLALGCPKKKDAGDDGGAEAAVAEVAEAAPPPAATVAATNENDISRFPDEKKLDNVSGTIQRTTNVREIPGIGKVVATLAKGGTVTEIAQRSTFFLVVFDNPKDNKRTMGWISQDSFTAQADAGLKVLTCTLPETPLFSDGPFCGKICANDVDCPTGQACKGAANKFVNAKLGDAVTVCTVFAPKPAVTPAQTATVTPPVVPPPPPPPPPPVAPAGDVGPASGGKCAPGFLLVAKDGQCHKVCRIGQCRRETTFCITCPGGSVCSANRDLCK